MNTGTRLAVYGAGLVVVFAGAFAVGGAVVPDAAVAAWQERAEPEHGADEAGDEAGGHGGTAPPSAGGSGVRGLSLAADGYTLSPVAAPTAAGRSGTLSFGIHDADGHAVTDFAVSHEKTLHLIVVRSDGAHFRHVHPTMSAAGVWSVDWRWPSAGSFRVFADFLPTGADAAPVTLTRAVDVAGELAPRSSPAASRADRTDGFDVRLSGDLRAGESSELTVDLSRDGRPVTDLQPYLGAYGHLVVLRQGDLGYLHVHAEGDEPTPGGTAGPTVTFVTTAPTAGRYLLYLDFRVDGVVRTATFVVDAA